MASTEIVVESDPNKALAVELTGAIVGVLMFVRTTKEASDITSEAKLGEINPELLPEETSEELSKNPNINERATGIASSTVFNEA